MWSHWVLITNIFNVGTVLSVVALGKLVFKAVLQFVEHFDPCLAVMLIVALRVLVEVDVQLLAMARMFLLSSVTRSLASASCDTFTTAIAACFEKSSSSRHFLSRYFMIIIPM